MFHIKWYPAPILNGTYEWDKKNLVRLTLVNGFIEESIPFSTEEELENDKISYINYCDHIKNLYNETKFYEIPPKDTYYCWHMSNIFCRYSVDNNGEIVNTLTFNSEEELLEEQRKYLNYNEIFEKMVKYGLLNNVNDNDNVNVNVNVNVNDNDNDNVNENVNDNVNWIQFDWFAN